MGKPRRAIRLDSRRSVRGTMRREMRAGVVPRRPDSAGTASTPSFSSAAPGPPPLASIHLAALATGQIDRWQAGVDLMRAENPAGSAALATASRLMNANAEALQACSEAAKKAGKEQNARLACRRRGSNLTDECTLSGAQPWPTIRKREACPSSASGSPTQQMSRKRQDNGKFASR